MSTKKQPIQLLDGRLGLVNHVTAQEVNITVPSSCGVSEIIVIKPEFVDNKDFLWKQKEPRKSRKIDIE